MVLNRDQELWGVALWVEKNHGVDGYEYLAKQIQRLADLGDEAGVATWEAVCERFDRLNGQGSTN